MVTLLAKETKLQVRTLIKQKMLPVCQKPSVRAILGMDLDQMTATFREHVPQLHEMLVASMTAVSGPNQGGYDFLLI